MHQSCQPDIRGTQARFKGLILIMKMHNMLILKYQMGLCSKNLDVGGRKVMGIHTIVGPKQKHRKPRKHRRRLRNRLSMRRRLLSRAGRNIDILDRSKEATLVSQVSQSIILVHPAHRSPLQDDISDRNL